jgi:hypothetical protein
MKMMTFQVMNTKKHSLTAMPLRGWHGETYAVPRAALRLHRGYQNYTPYGVIRNAQNHTAVKVRKKFNPSSDFERGSD